MDAQQWRAAGQFAEHDCQRCFGRLAAVRDLSLESNGAEHSPFGGHAGGGNSQKDAGLRGSHHFCSRSKYLVAALASDRYAARSFAFGTAPLSRRPSISLVLKPSSLRTASLCSPGAGARLAGTFTTPRTLMGLLIVEVSLPPAPSSGTTMLFARNWGSLITSSGPRTAPHVAWTPSKTSCQCPIGSLANTSSRIAVSCGMFARSLE